MRACQLEMQIFPSESHARAQIGAAWNLMSSASNSASISDSPHEAQRLMQNNNDHFHRASKSTVASVQTPQKTRSGLSWSSSRAREPELCIPVPNGAAKYRAHLQFSSPAGGVSSACGAARLGPLPVLGGPSASPAAPSGGHHYPASGAARRPGEPRRRSGRPADTAGHQAFQRGSDADVDTVRCRK